MDITAEYTVEPNFHDCGKVCDISKVELVNVKTGEVLKTMDTLYEAFYYAKSHNVPKGMKEHDLKMIIHNSQWRKR